MLARIFKSLLSLTASKSSSKELLLNQIHQEYVTLGLLAGREAHLQAEKLIGILLPWDVFLYESKQRSVIKDLEEKMV